MYSLPFASILCLLSLHSGKRAVKEKERSLTGKKENLISYAKWRLVAYIR